VRVWTLSDLCGSQAISPISEWCNNASFCVFLFFLGGWGEGIGRANVMISGSVEVRPMVSKDSARG
jgi:hypothetical protein